jgi:hypothetical protein
MRTALLVILLGLTLAACVRHNPVRSAAQNDFSCHGRVSIDRLDTNRYEATGCGQSALYVCAKAAGQTSCWRESSPSRVVVAQAPSRSFDQQAASVSANQAAMSARSCKMPDGPTGEGSLTVTLLPSGGVSQVAIDHPFGGTPTGACVASHFMKMAVPPFDGAPITVKKRFQID